MAKKRLLFCIEDMQINGAVTSLLGLLQILVASGQYDLSLFLFSHAGELTAKIPEGIKLLPESLPYAILRLPRRNAIVKALKSKKVHLALWRMFISFLKGLKMPFLGWRLLPRISGDYDVAIAYCDGFQAQMVVKKVDALKKLCWIHNDYNYYRQSSDTYRAFAVSDVAVAVSNSCAKAFLECYRNVLGKEFHGNMLRVHNPVDESHCWKLAYEYKVTKDIKFRIVTVGRISPQKGIDLIPAIAKMLKTWGFTFEWVVVGAGDLAYTNQIRQMIKTYEVEDMINLIGALANPMPWVLSADLIVQPSRFEAWGITVSEAFSLGKVVITSDLPVFREQIADFGGKCGRVAGNTIEDFARVIALYISDPKEFDKHEAPVSLPTSPSNVLKEFDDLMNFL